MKKFQNENLQCNNCSVCMKSVFNVLDKEHIEEITKHKFITDYKKGQYIFSEHGFPLGLFCVNNGKIKLITKDIDGNEQILRFVNSGDTMGYRALLANERYNCSAIALEDSTICIIDKNYFYQSIESNNKLLFEIVRKISNDLKDAEEHIVSLSQKNVRERIAEALLFIKSTYGFAEDGQTINIALSREEIASYVGTSTESTIRLLSEFNKDKIIELSGKKIKITNLPRLIKTANICN